MADIKQSLDSNLILCLAIILAAILSLRERHFEPQGKTGKLRLLESDFPGPLVAEASNSALNIKGK